MSDYIFNNKTVIPFETMRSWVQKIFMVLGMDEHDSFICADSLAMADLRGVYSHGCVRVPVYYDRVIKGGTSFTAKPEIIKDSGATALIDGHNAMGQVASDFAVKLAIKKAKEFGTSAVSVTGSGHQGACAYFSMQAAAADMIGFVWTINCGNVMAPFGGVEPQLGNNPFSIAIPCGKHADIVLDMATSVVAKGKIELARKTKTPVPDTWALDKYGKPTTDPEEAYWGTVQPSGGYKGVGLTFVNAMISAVLSGSNFGPQVTDLAEVPQTPNNTGHLFQLIDISRISDVDAFKARMDEAVDYIKSGKRAEGVDELFVPGEIEDITMRRQLESGIVYPVEVIEEINAIAEKYGVEKMPL